jgi:hypothetical protein
MISRKAIIATLAALAAAPMAQACAVCFGKSDSPLAQGLNMGIVALLLVITAVLALISTFFVFIARRSSQLERQQLSQTTSQNLTKH